MIPDPDLTDPVAGPERPLWEPLGGTETVRAFTAFARYRDLGPLRTARRAAAAFYGTGDEPTEAQLKQFKRWSAEHSWVERAEAWDLHLDEIARTEQVLAVTEMNSRQADWGRFLQAKAAQSLGDEVNLSIPQALKAMEVGAKMERVARGEPDTIQRNETAPDDLAAQRERAHAVLDELEAARERRASRG